MPNGDPMITPRGDQVTSLPTTPIDTKITQKDKKPNKFLSVLGGVASGALNLVAPGVGALIGNAIGGSGSSFSSYEFLTEQRIQFENMQRYNHIANIMQQQQNQAMTRQQQKHSYQMIELQNRVSMQAQEFSTVSNLLKSRHDSEMTAVNNIKS